jgi:hypothetical protein
VQATNTSLVTTYGAHVKLAEASSIVCEQLNPRAEWVGQTFQNVHDTKQGGGADTTPGGRKAAGTPMYTERALSTPPDKSRLAPANILTRQPARTATQKVNTAVWRSEILGGVPAPSGPPVPTDHLGRVWMLPASNGGAEPFTFYLSAFHQTGVHDLAELTASSQGRWLLCTVQHKTHTVRLTISSEEAGVGANSFVHQPGSLGIAVVVNLQGLGFKVRQQE